MYFVHRWFPGVENLPRNSVKKRGVLILLSQPLDLVKVARCLIYFLATELFTKSDRGDYSINNLACGRGTLIPSVNPFSPTMSFVFCFLCIASYFL